MRILLSLFLFALVSCGQNKSIDVLILSGCNNHDWKTTTPVIENLLSESGLFKAHITEKPDTLKGVHLKKIDVILSNWNSWPENDIRWPSDLETVLLQFIENGGGFVTFHASTSAFYNWPEFKSISTAAWIDSTWHGGKE